jgi:hypothetical protein
MSDDPKVNPTSSYPVRASKVGQSQSRMEPIVSPALLQRRFLANIPTKFKNFEFTAEDFQDQIDRAVSLIEAELNIDLVPVQRAEKVAYHRDEYRSFVHLRTVRGPILQVDSLIIRGANGDNIYQVPNTWIDPGQFHARQINVIPLFAAYGVNSVQGSAPASMLFLTTMAGLTWIPSYWEITYVSGLCDMAGHVPIFVNELIGIYAAKEILSQAQTYFTKTSVSIQQDGLSQSTGGPGPQVYAKRIEDLEKKEAQVKKNIKKLFGQKYIMGYY